MSFQQNESEPIRVMVVDDHPLVREGMTSVVSSQPEMRLVGEAANGEEGVQQYRQHRPSVTLMDLRMPVMGGLEALQAIRRDDPDARIIILTTYRGDAQALRAIKAGASGYLLKSSLRRDLLDTIRAVHAGRRCIPADVASELALHLTDVDLSKRETGVLHLVAAGNANKRIAKLLQISEETVKAHVRNILAKLGANDRTHAVTIALQRGIIDM
jgi:DNA-binding NarL/FixJ family response regulator